LKREPVWKAHRSHIYQRIVQTGWPHTFVASYYGFWALLCAIAGMFFLRGCNALWVWGVEALFAVTTWWLTRYLGQRKIARERTAPAQCRS